MKYGERARPPKIPFENEGREQGGSPSNDFVLYFIAPGFIERHSYNRPQFGEQDFNVTVTRDEADLEIAHRSKKNFFGAVVQFDPEGPGADEVLRSAL